MQNLGIVQLNIGCEFNQRRDIVGYFLDQFRIYFNFIDIFFSSGQVLSVILQTYPAPFAMFQTVYR